MTLWPHQTQAVSDTIAALAAGQRKICVTSPTGGGKTWIICMLIEWAVEQGKHVVLYTNRRLLIEQLSRVLEKHGIKFGVRAAGYEDRRELQVQIASLPTERMRTLKTERWTIHGHGKDVLAIVDEAHLNASGTAQKVLALHHDGGGAYVGFTATPINLGHLYETLIVAGTPTDLRNCGALVPAYHYGPDEPDMRGFKPSVKTGEYSEDNVRKAIMTPCIFGRVWDHWIRINPEQRPTLLFAPGVNESIWFAQQFRNRGIRAAHIDGEGVWIDGEYHRGTDRQRILEAVRTGEIKVLCNRFVLREGLDLPEVSHLIVATVMGSVQSYLQSCGRGLRKAPGKDRCTIQDHGGHWWRHGSVNIDRQWELVSTDNIIRAKREETLRQKKEPEPICCPKCSMIRASGAVCPGCGHEWQKRSRIVIQQDGKLTEHHGDIFRPRLTTLKPDTVKLWKQNYYRCRHADMTFRAARGLFFKDHGYWPSNDLPLMPTREVDWFQKIKDVPPDRLT
jgi:superfamily II DNA or RNA helicase